MRKLPLKFTKTEKASQILFGLVELYMHQGTFVSSQQLKDSLFPDVSSATIRNYFNALENEGFLSQPHSSSGRIPTQKAIKLYVESLLNKNFSGKKLGLNSLDDNRVVKFLEQATAMLSDILQMPVVITQPILEKDCIQYVQLVKTLHGDIVCISLTKFGTIHTETFYRRVSALDDKKLKWIEQYFKWRLNLDNPPEDILDTSLIQNAKQLFNEFSMKYITNNHNPNRYLTTLGLSHIPSFKDFSSTEKMSAFLQLFEQTKSLLSLLTNAMQKPTPTVLIGTELEEHFKGLKESSAIVVPYYISGTVAGSIAVFGPLKMQYKKILETLVGFVTELSQILTKRVQLFQITFKPLKNTTNCNTQMIMLAEQRSCNV